MSNTKDFSAMLSDLRRQFAMDPEDSVERLREMAARAAKTPREALAGAMQICHNLKGSAQAVGLAAFADQMHEVESALMAAVAAPPPGVASEELSRLLWQLTSAMEHYFQVIGSPDAAAAATGGDSPEAAAAMGDFARAMRAAVPAAPVGNKAWGLFDEDKHAPSTAGGSLTDWFGAAAASTGGSAPSAADEVAHPDKVGPGTPSAPPEVASAADGSRAHTPILSVVRNAAGAGPDAAGSRGADASRALAPNLTVVPTAAGSGPDARGRVAGGNPRAAEAAGRASGAGAAGSEPNNRATPRQGAGSPPQASGGTAAEAVGQTPPPATPPAPTPTHTEPPADTGPDVSKYLLMEQAGQLFAVGLAEVREIISHLTLIPLPEERPGLRGMIVVRNRALPVLNLGPGFDATSGSKTCAVICESDSQTFAFSVERPRQVITFNRRDFEGVNTKLGDTTRTGLVKSVGKLDDRSVLIIDLKAMLAP